MSDDQAPYNPYLGGAPTTTRPETLNPESVKDAMAEAKDRSLDFDPATRAKFIEDNVRDIKVLLDEDKTESEIRAAFPEFISAYPELFRKLVAREDMSNLKTMLTMMSQMATGSLSHHQASMIVGTRLAERYLPAEFKPSRQGGNARR